MFKRKKIDFLAVGDIVIDAFIKLDNAHMHCNIDVDSCELCVPMGDKIPYKGVTVVPAVGNSPNASVAAKRLGLRSALYTNIGSDPDGQKCLEALKKNKIITKYIKAHKKLNTNYHYVLWYEAERTILVKHTLFPYAWPKNLPEISWVYLSSLAPNSLSFHQEEIVSFLNDHPETKLAFQPGTFQIQLGQEKLKDIYKRSEVFYCNKEEAQKILNTNEKDIKNLLNGLKNLGPRIVVITNGPAGAYAFDGKQAYFVPMYPDPNPPIDRTGAGDSFSATFTVALALGKTIPEALTWAPINSMSVVQYVGAQEGLLNREKLENYLKEAPENYKVKKI